MPLSGCGTTRLSRVAFQATQRLGQKKNLIDGEHADEDTGEIQLELIYRGSGIYEGEIHSSVMAEQFFAPWSRVMVSGEVSMSGIFSGEVWDVVANEKAPYVRFSLAIADRAKGTLRLTPIAAKDGVFPGEVILWPTRREMSGGMPGKRFHDALKRTLKQP